VGVCGRNRNFLLTGKLLKITKLMLSHTRLVNIATLRLWLRVPDLDTYDLGKHMPELTTRLRLRLTTWLWSFKLIWEVPKLVLFMLPMPFIYTFLNPQGQVHFPVPVHSHIPVLANHTLWGCGQLTNHCPWLPGLSYYSSISF